MMQKAEILKRLRQNQTSLQAYGVAQVGLFGSFVRDEADEQSDIDLLVDFEPEQKNFLNFMELSFFLEELLGRNVDLVTTDSLHPYLAPTVLSEVAYVFTPS